MNLQVISSLIALAQLSLCTPVLQGRDACTSNDLSLPSGGMKGHNGIFWGWAPDDGAGTNIETINRDTGRKASTYGKYSQIGSTSYDTSQLTDVLSAVVESGAVFIPSIMPTGVTFSQIDSGLATQIAAVLEKFTSQGVEVWLRFAHEVNYYVTKGSGSDGAAEYEGGTSAEFIKAWQLVHDAVANNPKILMFWSPNVDTASEPVDPWWPGPDYVDIVGVDAYPGDLAATFASTYGPFYDKYAKRYNKHFCIGETGFNTTNIPGKEAWVKQLANFDLSAYPCFKSATWFEYDKVDENGKGVDFRLIEGQSAATVKETLSNFQ